MLSSTQTVSPLASGVGVGDAFGVGVAVGVAVGVGLGEGEGEGDDVGVGVGVGVGDCPPSAANNTVMFTPGSVPSDALPLKGLFPANA